MAAVYSPPNDIAIQPQPPKLRDRLRHVLRAKHYSYRTEQAYVGWVRRFILFHGKRHPQEMGGHEIEQFLTHLAVDGRVAASTQTHGPSTANVQSLRAVREFLNRRKQSKPTRAAEAANEKTYDR